MNPYQRLQDRFKCPKCHNQTSVYKEVSLSKVSQKILGGPADKYIFISCALCGYTETYNLKMLVHADEKEPIRGNNVLEPRQG